MRTATAERGRVVLRLTDGRVVPLTSYYTSAYGAKRETADRIAAFLGIPLDAAVVGTTWGISGRGRPAGIAIALMALALGALFGGVMDDDARSRAPPPRRLAARAGDGAERRRGDPLGCRR